MTEHDEQTVVPGGKIALVVCLVLLLGALTMAGFVRWMRPAPQDSTYRPMNLSNSSDDDTTPLRVTGGVSTPTQNGRVGADHPVPAYSPPPGYVPPSGPGVVGIGGKPVAR